MVHRLVQIARCTAQPVVSAVSKAYLATQHTQHASTAIGDAVSPVVLQDMTPKNKMLKAMLSAIAITILLDVTSVHSQGVRPEPGTQAGASNALTRFNTLYARSKSLRANYRANRRSACSGSSGSLCGPESGRDGLLQLLIATSPAAYDARSRAQVCGVLADCSSHISAAFSQSSTIYEPARVRAKAMRAFNFT